MTSFGFLRHFSLPQIRVSFYWWQYTHNPHINDEDILLGSNEKTRFNQNKVGRYFEAAKRKEIPSQEAIQQLKDNAKAYGLTYHHKEEIPYQSLVNKMEEWSKAGHKQILLVLWNPGVAGHAVNIQFDVANQIYRLIDDNLGLVRFESMEVQKEELATYFKEFYPEYTKFEFETYQ